MEPRWVVQLGTMCLGSERIVGTARVGEHEAIYKMVVEQVEDPHEGRQIQSAELKKFLRPEVDEQPVVFPS